MLFGISFPAWGPWESLSQESQVACPSCLKLSSIEFQPCVFKVSWLWSVTSLKVEVYRIWGGKASRKEKCVCFLFLSLLYVRVPLCPLTPASNCFKVSLRFSLWLSNLTWLSNLPVGISTSPVLCPLLSQGLSSVHCSLRACLSCHHLSFGLHWVSPCPAGWSNTVCPSLLGPFP